MTAHISTNNGPRPDGASWMTPYMTVEFPEKIIAFYQKAFKFDLMVASHNEKTNEVMHVEMSYQKQTFMMGKQGAYGFTTKSPASSGIESPISLYVYVDDVDAFYKHAVAHGAKSLAAPEDLFWGDRMRRLQDPEGYDWSFATCLNKA